MKNIIKLLTIIVLLIFTENIFSQTKITGIVIDSLSSETLPYAAVSLYDVNDSLLTACVTDTSGIFKIETKNKNFKTLKIFFLGYYSKTIILENSKNQNLGEIKLLKNESVLNEIEIEGDKANVKYFSNKIEVTFDSINVVNSKNSFELLKFIPGAMVLEDKNLIKINGNSNVIILINGVEKPTKNLKSLKPKDIEKVEIVKNSLEYSDNVSVILNIILKKTVKQGLSSDFLLDAESIYKNNSSNFNIEYGYHNVQLYVNYQFNSIYYTHKSIIERQNKFENKTFYFNNEQSIFDKNKSLNHDIVTGVNIFFKNNSTLFLATDFYFDNNQVNTFDNQNYYFDYQSPTIHKFYSLPTYKNLNSNYSVSYKKKYTNSIFSINFNYYNLNKNEATLYIDSIENNNITILNYNRSQENIYNRSSYMLKMNYDFKINQNFSLKNSYSIYNTELTENYKSQNIDYLLKINDFKNVLYSSLAGNLSGIDYSFGFKLQNFRHLVDDSLGVRNYFTPILNLSKSLNEKSFFEFTVMIMPMSVSIENFMSVEIFSDSLNSKNGNKNLLMQRVRNYANLSYSYFSEKVNFTSSLGFLYTKNMITPFYKIKNNVLTYQFIDVKNHYRSFLDLSLTLNLVQNLYFTQNHTFSFEAYKDSNYPTHYFDYSFYFNFDYYLPHNYNVGAEFYGSTKIYSIQGYYYSEPYVKFYLSKNILNNNGSLYLGISPLNSKQIEYYEGTDFYNKTTTNLNDRVIYLQFQYAISKGKELKQERIENIKDKE